MKIPIVGAAYRARSRNASAEVCINLYPEVNPDGSVRALYGTPGMRYLTSFGTNDSYPVRGLFVPAIGNMIVVCGDRVYRADGNLNKTLCFGAMQTTRGTVSIAENGTVAVIVDGNNGYILNLLTNVLMRITDPAFYGADTVAFLDGYFLFNKPGTQQFYWSKLYSTDFDALDFASAEGAPDKLIGLLVDHREAWMFGDTTIEVFYNTGDLDQPIQRMQGAFLEHGCAAPHSIAKLDNTVFWLGKDANGSGTIWRANGYTPQRISTHALEYELQQYGVISDAFAYTYQQDGHAFYVITFPQANKTWCYDAATNLWHERSSWKNGVLNRHRSTCCVYYAGKHIVGDNGVNAIYALDADYYSEDGDIYNYPPNPLVSRRSAAVVSNDTKRLFHHSLQIEIEQGVGLSGSQQGDDPRMLVDWSDDWGRSWSNTRQVSMGKVGEYNKRCKLWRLGSARDRIYRVSISDPVKRVILAADLEATAGST